MSTLFSKSIEMLVVEDKVAVLEGIMIPFLVWIILRVRQDQIPVNYTFFKVLSVLSTKMIDLFVFLTSRIIQIITISKYFPQNESCRNHSFIEVKNYSHKKIQQILLKNCENFAPNRD